MLITQSEASLEGRSLDGQLRQLVEPEWVPLECSERGCREAVQCRDCERCREHCTHRIRAAGLGADILAFIDAEYAAERKRR